MKKDNITKISITGVFCALAFILTVVLKFKVAFLSFDLKDSVLAVISLMYGPLYGIVSAGIVAVLEFLSISDTGIYGLIMNFISSGAFCFISGILYKYKRTFKGAILSVICSVIGVCIVMMLVNILITPYYMGVSSDEVIKLIPNLLLPFNFCKTVINAAATVAIYKPIRLILKRAGANKSLSEATYNNKYKSIIIFIVSAIVIIVTIFVSLKLLGAQIDIF